MSNTVSLEQFLAPISERLGRKDVPEELVSCDALSKMPCRVHDQDPAVLVEVFCNAAEAMHVTVHRCTREGVADEIASIVSADISPHVIVPKDRRIDVLGISTILSERDIECEVWDSAKNALKNRQACLDANFGITFPVLAVAETGSVVQLCDADCGRGISLLPETHIAVIESRMIRGQMSQALAELAEIGGEQGADLPSQICFISGPSNTSDIELVRVEGVHGPMYVHYIVIEA